MLTGAYTVTLSVATGPELLGAVVCGGLCAMPAVTARRALGVAWRPDPRWGSWIRPLAAAVAGDTIRLFGRVLPGLVARRPGGAQIRELRPPADRGAARAAARRAVGTLALSASPGSVVLDWPDDGPVVLHTLGSGGSALDGAVTR